ncbi:MAG: McrB family protein [Muribaculaceae bacterium]
MASQTLLKKLINDYKSGEDFNGFDELYKWQLLKSTSGKTPLEIVQATKGQNIVDNERVDGVFKKLLAEKSDALLKCVENLFDETKPLIDRLANYKAEMRNICPIDWKQCANDERTAAALLTCHNPQTYTFYKDEIYKLICAYFGYKPQKAGQKYVHYLEIINYFAKNSGSEIQSLMADKLNDFEIKPYNLAVQTLFWCMKDKMRQYVSIKATNEIAKDATAGNSSKYHQYIDLLTENYNLVLTGAPGTGKTYMAKEIAKSMNAVVQFVQFHPSYDYTDFVEGLRPIDNGEGHIGFERKDGVFKDFCKRAQKNLLDSQKSAESLTQELSWQEKLEQFIDDAISNGTKYKTVNGSEFCITETKGHSIIIHNEQNIKTQDLYIDAGIILDLLTKEVKLNIVRDIRDHYNRKFGTQADSYIFVIVKAIRAIKSMTILHTADKVELRPFVLIIDEINRGEASKIFGELFYAIDPGYRGNKDILVQTQYQNLVPESDTFADGFFVPKNVYILATMNDIDRSVESMDFAMRRRFTWIEVKPSDTHDMLDHLDCADKAKDTMNRLNDVISHTDGLGAAYMIGPSYFLKLGKNGGDLSKLWKMNIEPLLREYLRGFRKAEELLTKFKKAFFNTTETSDTPQFPE